MSFPCPANPLSMAAFDANPPVGRKRNSGGRVDPLSPPAAERPAP